MRTAVPADDDFILSLYASTRAEEMQRVPWTTEQKQAFVQMQFAAQKQHYAANYPQASHDVICVNEAAVGRIYLDRGAEVFHILDITVSPPYRNQGIGGALLRRLLEEAGQSGKAVTIYVETFNPSMRLFARLGFEKAQEKDFLVLMTWPAKP
ncbi:MAG TPA: GNAT family N-acetyltransferase [Candidatus Angelobacter sp.]|nr:GNAT family N-acetyltransferase [Candidatus Angelobacter sp.]